MIGIYGGTFDPVHFGHLRTALDVQENLGLDEVRLIPCHIPPHRSKPGATAKQRMAMLQLAIENQPGLIVDSREIERSGPSYMVDTLKSLRNEVGEIPLCLIVGADAFLGLANWHRWRDLFQYAHVIVMHRPGFTPSPEGDLAAFTNARCVSTEAKLRQVSAGKVLFQKVTQLEISASSIRTRIKQGKSPRYLLPDTVWREICKKGLYGLV
ncbi:MAG: nicotinate-nucleotide adenylyltransferase [Methylococcales bacterium]